MAGKVRLLPREDKAAELLLQLRTIDGHRGLDADCRALACRLYNHCEKTKQAEDARAYYGPVIAWSELEKRAAASSAAAAGPQQLSMVYPPTPLNHDHTSPTPDC